MPTCHSQWQRSTQRCLANGSRLSVGLRIGLQLKSISLCALARELVLVETTDARVGWVFVPLIRTAGLNKPEFPSGGLGCVTDLGLRNGSSWRGNQRSSIRSDTSHRCTCPRSDAMPDQTGSFRACIVASSSGSSHVHFAAIACTSSTYGPALQSRSGVGARPHPEGLVQHAAGRAYDPCSSSGGRSRANPRVH